MTRRFDAPMPTETERPERRSRPRTAIIVGGGIAGIACALRLAEHGVRVTLLETRRKLGGRATSFVDPRSGEWIDNCQHVVMGCCTNYLDLCRRLGVAERLEWHDEIYWVEAGGRMSLMKPGSLPAPAHFAGSLMRARFLGARDKQAITECMFDMLRCDRAEYSGITMGEWLRARNQTQGAIEKFWSPVIVSACNLGVDRVAASVAIHVFQEGFLASRGSARMGVSRVPLLHLYDQAEDSIRRTGGELRLGCGVERLDAGGVVTTAGERVEAEAVVCAVPGERARRMVDEATIRCDARFSALDSMEHSPIVGVHLVFDRPVLGVHSAVLVGRETQWVFRKDREGTRVHAVISAADELARREESDIVARVLSDLRACFRGARDARLTSFRAVKEKLATFAATPRFEAVRPATTGASGIHLAGDYVRTGWPATMEGAARSGYMAAAAVLRLEEKALLKPGLPCGRLARAVMSGRYSKE